jgi:hypothetical protein
MTLVKYNPGRVQ